MSTASFEPWISGLIARRANSMAVWAVVLQECIKVKFAQQPGIEDAVDGKVQRLETSDNKLCKARWRAVHLAPKSLQYVGQWPRKT